MKKWSHEEGKEFTNSDVCFGREYKPDTDAIDVAKISIRGRFPASGWGYLDVDEMAVITRGVGYALTREGERTELQPGDVVHVEPGKRWCWGGDMDMIVICSPAFSPNSHHMENE